MSTKYLVSVILVIAAAVLGYLFGAASASRLAPSPSPVIQQSVVARNPIFKSQTAIFQGVITQVSGRNLAVKDDKGTTATFPVSSKVVIYKFNGNSPQATGSSDLQTIETGKQVLVMLELINNQYQVTSVSFLPPPPKP